MVVIINSLKVPKIKKILLYEMKFLVRNYSCLQNPWLGGYCPQIPALSVPYPQLNLLNPAPPNKITGYAHCWTSHVMESFQVYCNCECPMLIMHYVNMLLITNTPQAQMWKYTVHFKSWRRHFFVEVRFKNVTAVTMKNAIFWDVMACSVTENCSVSDEHNLPTWTWRLINFHQTTLLHIPE